jgi:UDP-N-acetylglucosamine--N-acetylmuramyl-(pentapeptide) pyrophosphoryl-undecaprenol N-acetylglucosamine transferase
MKYLLTGGGTGGHVYPALAVADDIRRREPDAVFLYVGVRGRLEERVVPAHGYSLKFVRSRPFPRSLSLVALSLFALNLSLGVLVSSAILLRFRPHIIFATGGFASAPIMFAFGILRKIGLSKAKVLLYEPNAQPGMLNHAVGRLADRIGVAFEEAGRWFDMKRVAVVGYPVRREILEADRSDARQRLRIDADTEVVLITGGSNGSRVINQATVEALPTLRPRDRLLILHITGRYSGPDYNAVEDTERDLDKIGLGGDQDSWYRRMEYSDDIQDLYAAADIVVCRAGAGTLTEVCLCGLAAVVVPLATSAEDHQAANARELERKGAVRVLYQGACWNGGRVETRLDGGKLAVELLSLLEAPERRRKLGSVCSVLPKRNSLELIQVEIAALTSRKRPPPLSLEFPERHKSVPGEPNSLLRYVRKRLEEVGGCERLEASELAYLRYQADRYLVSEGWYEIPLGKRNVGIKLVAILGYQERLGFLIDLLTDRRRASGMRRLFGGDFHHPGILRRNVIEYGFRHLDVSASHIEGVLVGVLQSDPYFEVRAAAAAALGQRCISDGSEGALLAALRDRSPRVVIHSLRSLGETGHRPELLESLRGFYLHADSQFRQEVVVALQRLLSRAVLRPEDVEGDVDQILATSAGFEPSFPLKESLRALVEQLRSATAQKRSGTGEG